jgi:hypothetical protein
MSRPRVMVVILVAFALVPALAAAQPTAVYDNFSTPLLDPVKWRGTENIHSNTLGVRDTEISRALAGGQFRASLRTFGATGVDFGVSGSSRNRIHINHPDLVDQNPRITVIQARVTPKAAIAEDCPINTSETRARAVVFGFFFNDGTANATAGDQTGDILAGVQLERHSKLGDRIFGFLARCDQSQCADAQAFKAVTFAHAWTINVAQAVSVRWRPGSKDFQFVVGGESQILTYGDVLLFDSELPKSFFFPIGVQTTVANCTEARVEAYFDALFDNVSIDPAAVSALGP